MPSRLKDVMADPQMYLQGWSHRPFTFRPEQRKSSGDRHSPGGSQGLGQAQAHGQSQTQDQGQSPPHVGALLGGQAQAQSQDQQQIVGTVGQSVRAQVHTPPVPEIQL